MPTKKELEAELESLKRSNAALKGQITKLESQLDEQAESDDTELRAAVRRLLNAIEAKSLTRQIGNRKEVSDVVRALAT